MSYTEQRGGRRAGAGRKTKGITKKVSLTLSKELWNEINEFDGTYADYIRALKEQINNLNEVTQISTEAEIESSEKLKKVTEFNNNKELTRHYVEQHVKIYTDEYVREQSSENKPSDQAIADARKSLFNSLFNNYDIAEIETSMRYRSPFSNKWFSSMKNLLKTEVPRLISNAEAKIKRKKEKTEQATKADNLERMSKENLARNSFN
jgi:hypothetical protein